jgi:hypothetical protein
MCRVRRRRRSRRPACASTDVSADASAYTSTGASINASAYAGAYAYADARDMFAPAGERWLLCAARGYRDSLGFDVFWGRNVDKR